MNSIFAISETIAAVVTTENPRTSPESWAADKMHTPPVQSTPAAIIASTEGHWLKDGCLIGLIVSKLIKIKHNKSTILYLSTIWVRDAEIVLTIPKEKINKNKTAI
jgi:hypothetical protein